MAQTAGKQNGFRCKIAGTCVQSKYFYNLTKMKSEN